MTMGKLLLQTLVAAGDSATFGALFQVEKRHYLACAITGAAGWVTYCLAVEAGCSVAAASCLGALPLTLLARLLASPLASIFVGYDETLHALTEHAFRLISFSFLLSGFNIFTSAFFTALNNGFVSAAISFLRTLLFQTCCVLVLPVLFDIDGIWWAITAAEVFAFAISLTFLLTKRKKYGYM